MTLSHRENNELADLRSRLADLERQVRQLPSRPAQMIPAPSLVVEVIQAAHGWTLGQLVTNAGVSWDLAVAGDDKIGVVCKVVDADTAWICEWGIVCIEGATFAESETYYLGATAGLAVTTPGTPKRAVFFAVSPTMILVTNPAKDAVGGGLDAIAGPAVLGKADAGSGIPAAIPAAADDTIMGRRAGALTFAKIATAEISDDAVTAAKLADTAVAAGSYAGRLDITVDAQGRLTAAAALAVGNTYNTDQTVKAEGQNFVGSISGTYWQTVINWQTGAPVFNAKWLRGTDVSTTAPTDKQFMRCSGTSWAPYGPLLSHAMDLLTHDGTDLAYVAAPGADDLILGRRGGALTWAKIKPAELENTTVTAAVYGSATQVPTITVDAQGRITAASNLTMTPDWANITSKPATFAPSAHSHTLVGDVSGTTATAVVDKIKGTAVSATAPTTLYQFLKYDTASSTWLPFSFVFSAATSGRLLQVDTSAASGFAEVQSEVANTLIGRSSATAGVIGAIGASVGVSAAEGTVMQRAVGGNLAFATTIVLGKAAATLGGWKVNASTTATASEWEASGTTNSLTAKYNGTTVLEVKAGSTQQIVCKNTSGTAGTTIQIDWSGNSPRLQMFRPDISTTVPMLDINLATAPTGGWTTAKAVTLREIDVCDSGTAKKVMRMESAPY